MADAHRTPSQFFYEVVLSYRGDDCLIWPYSKNLQGYAQFWIKRRGSASRHVCEYVYGPPPTSKHEVAHSCGRGHLGCVAPRHLRWATRSENHADKIIHGTHRRGERCPTGRLTEAQVREIRRLKGTMSLQAIAEQFGISKGHVGQIHTRGRWGWME